MAGKRKPRRKLGPRGRRITERAPALLGAQDLSREHIKKFDQMEDRHRITFVVSRTTTQDKDKEQDYSLVRLRISDYIREAHLTPVQARQLASQLNYWAARLQRDTLV